MNNNNERRFFLKLTSVFVSSALFSGVFPRNGFAIEQLNDRDIDHLDVYWKDDINVEHYALNIFRAGILFGLGKIPVLGELISSVTAILWPSGEDSLWDTIKSQVEELLDHKIDQAVYAIIGNMLNGLSLNIKAYLGSLKTENKILITANFAACHNLFINQGPQFCSEDRKAQLLPLYATFALLHLTLLRDAVLNAKAMGWDDKTTMYYSDVATNKIKEYGEYIDTEYRRLNAINESFLKKTLYRQGNPLLRNSFFIRNEFQRKMQLTVLDSRSLFEYMDPVKYPNSMIVTMDRVVYSWPIGSARSQGAEVNYDKNRTLSIRKPTSFNLYSGGHELGERMGYAGGVVGYRVNYEHGSGPWGRNEELFGRHNHDDGNRWINNESDNGPVVAVWYNRGTFRDLGYVKKGDSPNYDEYFETNPEFLYSLMFEYENGVFAGVAGGCSNTRHIDSCIYINDHVLVDICGQGYQERPGMVGCAIFGFQLKNMGHILKSDTLMRLHYISSINNPNLSEVERIVGMYQEDLKPIIGDVANPQEEFALKESTPENWHEKRAIFWNDCLTALSRKLTSNSAL